MGGPIDPAVCGLEVAEVDALLARRLQAKLRRDFATADALQAELCHDHGVQVHDGRKEWRADGETFGDVGPRDRGGKARGESGSGTTRRRREWTRVGVLGDGVTEADVAFVEAELRRRADAKALGDYDLADEIRDRLRDEHEVSVDDRNLQWNMRSDRFARAAGSGPLGEGCGGEAAVEEVERLLAERMEARWEARYADADAIRDELRDRYGVSIDDRYKEWSVEGSSPSPPPGGAWDEEEDEAKEADAEMPAGATAEVAAGASLLGEDELMALTVPALKERCREAGLRVGGRKAELVERLLEAQS